MPAFALPLLGAIKDVPRFVWIALAAALFYAFALNWHAGKVKALELAAYERGHTAATNAMKGLQAERERRDARLAEELRRKHNEEVTRIAGRADDLRLRGPGRSLCPDRPVAAAGAGRHNEADRPADAPGSEVPAGERAAVPWGWLTDRAEAHDLYRSEALAWREWYARFSAEWEAWKAEVND